MSVLSKVIRERHLFDPNNKKHLDEFKYFLVNNKWQGSCPFELTWPYLNVPDMIKDLIVNNYLKIK